MVHAKHYTAFNCTRQFLFTTDLTNKNFIVCSASVLEIPLTVGDRVSCSASKVLGEKPAKQKFGRLSTTKELYGIVQKPQGTGSSRSVKYVVCFSEVEVTKAFSPRSLKHQATVTDEANSTSDAHVQPSISAVEPASPAVTLIAQQHEL